MRKPDLEVREVVCSETGKPMPKIPLWMADIKVKFVSDEARQKHPAAAGMAELEPASRRALSSRGEADPLKDLGLADSGDDADPDFDEDANGEDESDDDSDA